MRSHIWIFSVAFIFTACASYRGDEVSRNPAEEKLKQERAQRSQMIDAEASRLR